MFVSYRAFRFPVLDLGLFNRHMYSLMRLDFSPNPLKGFNLLGDHAHIFLIALAPIYFFWRDPSFLLFVQVITITLSIFPIYLIGKHYLKSQLASLMFVIAYLFFFGLWAALAYPFHDAPVAVLPISWALYHLLVTKKLKWLVVWLVILCTMREDMPLVAAMFGVYTAIFDRRWKAGLIIIAGAVAYMLVVMQYLLGSLGPGYVYTQNPFGNSMTDVIKAAFTQPIELAKQLFWSPKEKLKTALYMLGSFSGLSLLAPQILFLMAPLWMGRTLTTQPWRWSVIQHYSASQAPFLVVSAIMGLALVLGWLAHIKFFNEKRLRITMIAVSCVVVCTSITGSILTNNYQYMRIFDPNMYSLGATEKSAYRAMDMIPADASVAVQGPFPRLTTRGQVFNVPFPQEVRPEYVITMDALDFWPFGTVEELTAYRQQLKATQGYTEVYNQDKVILLHRNAR